MIELAQELNSVPERVQHIHLMGICGTGMAALAGMLQQSGYTISGSDQQVYPPMSVFLENLKIQVREGYRGENLQPRPDLVIVGNVITRKNPEAIALAERNIPYLSFPQALAHFFIAKKHSIVISGTHGKTTTCSLLATSLYHIGTDPSFMIGGIVQEFATNFRLGHGPHFISEGDEYDTAFFDKGSKFLHYRPQIAVITSIEFDHADIFADLDAIKNSFARFVRLIPPDGLLIAHLEDPNVAEIAALAACTVQGYGESPEMTWAIRNIEVMPTACRFTVYHHGKHYHDFVARVTGRHNCLNSLATIAVMHHLGLAPEDIAAALEKFAGVKRRQEVRGVVRGITIIDDFAHHPTAVRETLAALKAAYRKKRLIAVFEPRTNSSRRAIFQQDYIEAFDHADVVLIREPLPLPGLARQEMFSAKQLADDLRNRKNLDVVSYPNTDAILEHLGKILVSGDVVAILSNGGFDNIHSRLLAQLAGKMEKMEKDG